MEATHSGGFFFPRSIHIWSDPSAGMASDRARRWEEEGRTRKEEGGSRVIRLRTLGRVGSSSMDQESNRIENGLGSGIEFK